MNLVASNESDLFRQSLSDSLTKQQIKEFCFMINEIENKIEQFPEVFSVALYRFIEFLLVKNLIDYSKQVCFFYFFVDLKLKCLFFCVNLKGFIIGRFKFVGSKQRKPIAIC